MGAPGGHTPHVVYCCRLGTNLEMLPYFNGGVIAVPKNSLFPDTWIECANTIYSEPIRDKLPWLDQLAIPIVIEKLKLKYGLLDKKYNTVDGDEENGVIIHYHFLRTLFANYKYLIDDMRREYPEL